MGDAVMLRVPEAAKAAGLAERIVYERAGRHRALGVGVGMHTGTAVRRGDDWFGSAVNVASRVADAARAGEVLCTEATRQALGPAVRVRKRGTRSFKNLVEPLVLYELVVTLRSGEALPVDPVCHMAVNPARAVGRRRFAGKEYHFCSERCAQAFDSNPHIYLQGVDGTRER